MPRPKFGIRTVTLLCAGLLAVGLIVENLAWLSPSDTPGVPYARLERLGAALTSRVEELYPRFPDTPRVSADELERPGSVLSVRVEERYLRNPWYGLLNQRRARGRDWEHPAVMSYFEDGKLEVISNVGLRLHGGASRKVREDMINVRLYFRRDHDSEEFRPGAIFGGRRNPIEQLIIDNDRWENAQGVRWHLNSALAYDIARRIGALAPETHPVSFVLNGQSLGPYVLMEPIRRPFFRSRFGHDDFESAYPSHPQRPSHFELPDPWHRQPFREVLEELRDGAPFTLAEASRWIDVGSLSRWFVSIVFCATTDPFQAPILRDRTHPDSLWFWINWDMDHSFVDLYDSAPVPWLHDTFRTTLAGDPVHNETWGRNNEAWERDNLIESYLIGRLLAEDPAYRDYLAREFLDALNYRLTPAFLDERYRYYRTVAERFGLGDEPYLGILEDFLEFRPAHVREQLVRELDLAPLRQVQLEAPRDAAFRIDGHAVTPGFSGWYVPGTEISVGIEGQGAGFSHWIVDGRRVPAPELHLKVEEDVVIEAEFHP